MRMPLLPFRLRYLTLTIALTATAACFALPLGLHDLLKQGVSFPVT